MTTYGYVRVSTADQNEQRQLIAMESYGISPERIFSEKQSGKNAKRPQLQALMDTAKEGDIIVVESISRFARNTKDLLNLVEKLTKSGVEFVSLKEYIDTTSPTGRFMLTIFAAVAELERESILIRQKEGIAAARARGQHLGRESKKPPSDFAEIIHAWQTKTITFAQALERSGLKRSTYYARLKEFREGRREW